MLSAPPVAVPVSRVLHRKLSWSRTGTPVVSTWTGGVPVRLVVSRSSVALDSAVASAQDASPAALAASMLRGLVAALGADGGALLLMDPHTGLFWTGAVDGLPAASCHPFFAGELEADAPRSFRRLASDGVGASALSLRSPTGDPFRTGVLEPFGYDDEVRVVARDAGVAWGAISLWRRLGTQPFSLEHERTLDAAAPIVGATLRDAVLRSLSDPGSRDATHAALVVEHGAVVEASPAARRLLHEIDEPDAEYRPLDHLVALTRTHPRFSVVMGTAGGRWVTAHGTALDGGRAVVVLTAPGAAELFGALVASAGLTAREVEVTRLLCRGLTDTEIARELRISPHTAQDHVRAVRTKLGVRSRAEVATRVFADRYFDRFLASASVAHSPGPGAGPRTTDGAGHLRCRG